MKEQAMSIETETQKSLEAIIEKAKIQRTEAEALIQDEKIKHEAALEELNN